MRQRSPAVLMRGSQSLWRVGGVFCLALLLQAVCLPAAGQFLTVRPGKGEGAVSRVAFWRYIAEDNPAFAKQDFDDSSWRVVSPAQSLPHARGLRNSAPNYTWARLHLHMEGEAVPLSIALTTASVFPYAVYANGRLLAESPGFGIPVLQHAEPFPIALPPEQEIALAVRIFCPPNDVMRSFPILKIDIGRPGAIETSTHVTRYEDFADFQIAELISAALSLAIATFAMTLFAAQSSRREYLWLAVLSVCNAVFTVTSVLILFGYITAGPVPLLIYREAGCLGNVGLLEFTPLLTRINPLRFIRPVQVLLVLVPLLALYSEPLFSYLIILTVMVVVVIVGIYFVTALRRRNFEAFLLSMPMVLLLLGTLLWFGNILFPARIPFPSRLHIGGLGLRADQLPMWLVFLTVFGIIQLRFVRVSRSEQQNTAELEAGRVIQSLLIPDQLPEVPGFALASVYHPALQVGGDFFQILPLSSGALIALGDVSGKGVPAAMTVALLVGTFRALAEQTQSPGLLLKALNGVLHGRGSGFTTCVVLRLDPTGERVVVASAGHLEPYLDGRALLLEGNLPLGVSPDTEFSEQTFSFRGGQRLTLLTDGVVEAFHPQTRELFGFERTLAVSHLPPAEIAAQVSAFTVAGPPSDDITVLSIAYA